MFSKRRRSLFKKANELAVKTNTELYVVMRRRGRYFTYKSTDRQGWPPNEHDVETNYPLTERQDPSSFRNIRCPRRNAQQSKSPNTYHETLGEGSNAERNQPPSPRIDESSNPDLEAMALLRAFKSGDIGPKDGASHELGRSGWSADIEGDCQLYEQHNTSVGFGRKTCNLVTEGYMDDGQEKNCLDMSSAPNSGRRKVIIPNVPEFSKLLEQCT